MIPSIVVIVISLVLAAGHIWWGRQHPLKELSELGNPVVVTSSYHACWYHISILFLVTAIVVAVDVVYQSIHEQVIWVLWVIIFGCWLTYLGVVYRYPPMRKLGWGQILLIFILLLNLGWLGVEGQSPFAAKGL